MVEGERKNWRELCRAALEARDPDELLKIVQELKIALKREEQVRRAFQGGCESKRSALAKPALATVGRATT
jgi:hypothetical protein